MVDGSQGPLEFSPPPEAALKPKIDWSFQQVADDRLITLKEGWVVWLVPGRGDDKAAVKNSGGWVRVYYTEIVAQVRQACGFDAISHLVDVVLAFFASWLMSEARIFMGLMSTEAQMHAW